MDEKPEGLIPNLRLIMEQGPLEGQTLEFVPGSKVLIGRIIRGNTVAIKDAGVSTKHLAINSDVKSGNWTLSDIGSSNGTVFNSVSLEPFSPVQLSDGDTIKIGEYTSIKVQVGAPVKATAEESKVRRNPPRRKGGKLGVVDENRDSGFGAEIENNENGKGGLENSEVSGAEDLNEGENENLKRTRSRKNKEGIENVGPDEAAMVKLRPRRGRVVKKEGILGDQNVAERIDQKQGQVESSKTITRNMRKGVNLESDELEKVLPVDSVKDGEIENNENVKGVLENSEVSGAEDLNEGEYENLKRTRSRKNKEGIENVGPDEAAVVKLRPRRGRVAKKEGILGDQNVAERIYQKQGQVESSKRITRNMRKGGNLESDDLEKVLPVDAVKVGESLSVRRVTRSSWKEGNIENLEEVGNMNRRKGGRGRRRKVEALIESVKDESVKEAEITEKLDLEVKENSVVKEVLEDEEGGVVDGMVGKEGRCSGMECFGAFGSLSGVKDGNFSELDLEKITLGEWLDYLDVNLPKQIIDDTEEMILGMRQKAEKFHQYMMLQENAKRQG